LVQPRVGGPVLAALLIPLLACPPTSIPTRDADQGGHYLASPYGGVHELEPTPAAPRSFPTPDVWLPLWDLDASLAEVEAQLALDEPPDWAPWVAWVLAKADAREGSYERLVDLLASDDLTAEHLAWWRAGASDPVHTLRMALDRSKHPRTRALLTTTLALIEHANSCPVAVDVDGACWAPGTNLLLRRRIIPSESAQRWTKLARKHWAKLDIEAEDLATRALWIEFQFALATADYESLLLDTEMPADLSFEVDEWRRDSGVAAWEREYARQVKRAEESKARVQAWFESTMDCARTQLDLHGPLLWIDARSTGGAFLRNARMLIAFAEMLDASSEREEARLFGPQRRFICVQRQSWPVWDQAHQLLDLCREHSQATLDSELDRACAATLVRIGRSFDRVVEFTGEPKMTPTMVRTGVIRPLDW
jgi:hypothetical protein